MVAIFFEAWRALPLGMDLMVGGGEGSYLTQAANFSQDIFDEKEN